MFEQQFRRGKSPRASRRCANQSSARHSDDPELTAPTPLAEEANALTKGKP